MGSRDMDSTQLLSCFSPEENNPCQAFICNCDRQAAICFFNTPYNKQYKRDNLNSCPVLCPSTSTQSFLHRASAHSISPRAVWQFSNAFDCTYTWIDDLSEYNCYGCYCAFFSWNNEVDELDRCCQTRDNCYAQVKKVESCKSLIDDRYGSFYTYLCSGNKVTCSEENSACEDLICNCDRQAAICFSKKNKGIQC
ncbi:phospholipase A2-like [Peromyscus leucopus]|uniref:phospholipase A2-like n=1 Tax=Peromyscus leucopus TaxID=10041 RepID=UPI00188494D5|nr:phospholipase A2-like [Peromyscus leucopus]